MARTPIARLRTAVAPGVVRHPLRVRLLEALQQPQSAASLGRELGIARQKLNYHLRELEREGLATLVEERRKGNCTERILRATARAYLVSPQLLGELSAGGADPRDQFSATYLIAEASRAVRDVATVKDAADRAGERLATLTLSAEVRFASAADRQAFAEALGDAFARLCARYHDESAAGGRRFRFLIGGYPVPAAAPAPASGAQS
jgi:biotin operon repressor